MSNKVTNTVSTYLQWMCAKLLFENVYSFQTLGSIKLD